MGRRQMVKPKRKNIDLKILKDTPSWEWPEDASHMFLDVLGNPQANPSDRLIAAKLAGDMTVINDKLADVLLSIVRSSKETEEVRCQAVISLGPALEQADIDGFEDPGDVPITEATFHRIQDMLHELYLDGDVPKEVRRRVLEASVRAPQDWHQQAIETAYHSDDENWKLTAVFCMRFVRGFNEKILEALDSNNPDLEYEAVCSAGNWEVHAAWPHIASLLTSGQAEKALLLAAIEAAAGVNPREAAGILADLAGSKDEDIAEAAYEAMAMLNVYLHDDQDEEEDVFQ